MTVFVITHSTVVHTFLITVRYLHEGNSLRLQFTAQHNTIRMTRMLRDKNVGTQGVVACYSMLRNTAPAAPAAPAPNTGPGYW